MSQNPHPTVESHTNTEVVFALVDRSDSWNTRTIGMFKSRSDAILEGVRRKNLSAEDREVIDDFSVRKHELK